MREIDILGVAEGFIVLTFKSRCICFIYSANKSDRNKIRDNEENRSRGKYLYFYSFDLFYVVIKLKPQK